MVKKALAKVEKEEMMEYLDADTLMLYLTSLVIFRLKCGIDLGNKTVFY